MACPRYSDILRRSVCLSSEASVIARLASIRNNAVGGASKEGVAAVNSHSCARKGREQGRLNGLSI
jgi:hypothetical protein